MMSENITAVEPQENTGVEADSDPFNIDKLIVDYDYLLYKIQDELESIQLKTLEICQKQNEIVEHGIIEEVIDGNIGMAKDLLQKFDDLEKHYDQLDAVEGIVVSFKSRLKGVITQYKKYIDTKK
ncbi:Cnl1 [Kluyveromyces lactis]|nr:Cnl1 [Kluyveromyces lactis]